MLAIGVQQVANETHMLAIVVQQVTNGTQQVANETHMSAIGVQQ